jgi:hypothetical protein
MNFRRLTLEELEPFRSEFITFLATNGIDAQQWKEINEDHGTKINDLIKQFSDLVWFKIFSNKKYMELHQNNIHYCFDFQSTEYRIVKIVNDEENSPMSISHQLRNYELSREEDMYHWMTSGAEFSDGKNYKQALLMIASLNPESI